MSNVEMQIENYNRGDEERVTYEELERKLALLSAIEDPALSFQELVRFTAFVDDQYTAHKRTETKNGRTSFRPETKALKDMYEKLTFIWTGINLSERIEQSKK